MPDLQANSDLLAQLRADVDAIPRLRFHTHPDSAMWMQISLGHLKLLEYVQIVADPACTDLGLGFIERITVEQWQAMRALVGHRVLIDAERLGLLTGTLVALTHDEARVDVGTPDKPDLRYLRWIRIGPAAVA